MAEASYKWFILCLLILAAMPLSTGTAAESVPPARAPVETTAGKAVDAKGAVAVDPTANVIALSEAATRRQDDLRELNFKLVLAELKRLDDLRLADARRLDELRAAESNRLDQQAKIRAEYDEKLGVAEANRINAIRAVDVGAVAVASERAAAQATVLANQVSASADALRTLVASTAATMATQQQNLATQFTDRLASLEKSQYENKGKAGVSDPMLTELVLEVKKLAEARSTTEGGGQMLGWIVAGVMFLMTVATFIIGFMRRPHEGQNLKLKGT